MTCNTDPQTKRAFDTTPFSLSSAARLGKVGLIVSNLERSLGFYRDVIGLDVLFQEKRFAQLGLSTEGRALLELKEEHGVRPLAEKRLGIYHFALLLPSRADLSSFAEHIGDRGIRAGMSDHRVSEAFYLSDRDGLQLEVCADRDSSDWLTEAGELAVTVQPLNLRNLLGEPHRTWIGVPAGSIVGHIHFYVGDVLEAERLYGSGLGMNVRTRSLPGALFVAAGKYHHHVGLNTWAGKVPAATRTESRLSAWELEVPGEQLSELQHSLLASGWRHHSGTKFVDRWGIALRLTCF